VQQILDFLFLQNKIEEQKIKQSEIKKTITPFYLRPKLNTLVAIVHQEEFKPTLKFAQFRVLKKA